MPQGRLLSPLPFTLFINDLTTVAILKLTTYETFSNDVLHV